MRPTVDCDRARCGGSREVRLLFSLIAPKQFVDIPNLHDVAVGRCQVFSIGRECNRPKSSIGPPDSSQMSRGSHVPQSDSRKRFGESLILLTVRGSQNLAIW